MSMGVLYVVATPIGNLQDVSPRAIEILSRVDVIAAEDTRHTRKLMQHFGIERPLLPLHDHNEAAQAGDVVARLQAGDSVALVSDAGTPLVSDPGFRLVRAAHAAGVQVSPIPGACAAIAALSAAGLPSDRFAFEGFLPAKSSARRARLQALKEESRTLVFYEAPHRILETLMDMEALFGCREATLARELTKAFETIRHGRLPDLVAFVRDDANQQRGEIVLMLSGATALADDEEGAQESLRILDLLLNELPLSRAVDLTVQISGKRKKWLYEEALKRRSQNEQPR